MHITNNLDPYECKKGKWERRNKWRNICFAIFVLGTVGAYIGHTHAGRSAEAKTIVDSSELQRSVSVELGEEHCTKTPDGSCSFATKENLLKWREYLESEVEKLKVEAGKPTAILSKVCRSNGITDSNCPKILYAMVHVETSFGLNMVGDHGRSEGWFQILNIHDEVTKACKYDLECSADWSLKRMISFGFKNDRDRGIRAHNGDPTDPVTLPYLQKVKKKMALWPS